jgi:hypothetical protein
MAKIKEKPIVIEGLEIRKVIIPIVGTSSLVCNRFTERSEKGIADKQGNKSTQPRGMRQPKIEYKESIYKFGKDYGFPSSGIKSAMVDGGGRFLGLKMQMKALKGMFFVLGDLVRIESESGPNMRSDVGRIPTTRTANLIYRSEFKQWKMNVPIRYNSRMISIEQLISLLNAAGFGVGIGAWRPECDGNHGMFEVQGEVRGID